MEQTRENTATEVRVVSLRLLAAVLIVSGLVFLSLVTNESNRTMYETAPLSHEAEHLLRTVSDRAAKLQDRVTALTRLGSLRERGVLRRLERMVPGEYDIMTVQILGVLGELGDDMTGDLLKKVTRQEMFMDGMLNVAFKQAIEACEQRTKSNK